MKANFQNSFVLTSFLLVILNSPFLLQTEASSLNIMPLGFKSKEGLPLGDVVVKQGELEEIPVKIELGKNYEIEEMKQMLSDLPSNVQAWISPNLLQNEINSKHILNATLTVLVDSEAQPGNYTLKITGSGTIKDLTTGNYTALTNETFESVHINIKSKPSPIRMDIGSPKLYQDDFCVKDAQGFTMCNSLVTYEEFPLTLYSHNKTTIQFRTPPVADGSWIKFLPEEITVDPNGSSAKMIMAGIEKPQEINPMSTKVMTIQAESAEGNITTDFLPIIKTQNLTVLDSPAPIEIAAEIGPNINSTNYGVFGVVYDPHDNSKSLPVSLSVLGLVKDGKVLSLPPWLQVEIPKPSFDLNVTQPYYFMINVSTKSAPTGNYSLAVSEMVGDKKFVEYIPLILKAPVFMGPPVTPGETNDKNSLNTQETDKLIKEISIPAPLKQIESGIKPNQVMCREDLKLIISADDFPACVKPNTAAILVERGWAKPIQS